MSNRHTDQHRGRFSSTYAQPCQPWKHGGGFRLMDFNTFYRTVSEGETPAQPAPGEFAVFDRVTREIGYFEWDAAFDADRIHSVIEGHFGVPAVRVFTNFWAV